MINLERLKKLLALLTIAFFWAIKTGEWRIENREEIKIKKHGRKEKSIFRHGLDWIRQEIWGPNISIIYILWKLIQPIFSLPIERNSDKPRMADCIYNQQMEQK